MMPLILTTLLAVAGGYTAWRLRHVAGPARPLWLLGSGAYAFAGAIAVLALLTGGPGPMRLLALHMLVAAQIVGTALLLAGAARLMRITVGERWLAAGLGLAAAIYLGLVFTKALAVAPIVAGILFVGLAGLVLSRWSARPELAPILLGAAFAGMLAVNPRLYFLSYGAAAALVFLMGEAADRAGKDL